MDLPLLDLFLILLAAFLGGRLAVRLGYPSVLGELAAGIVLGPPLLGLLAGGEAIAVLAEVGVLLMMLFIGMEIDPSELGKASTGGILAALGGFVVPFALGFWVILAAGGTVMAAVFVGMAMGVTSLATKSRILVDLRILDTRIAHVMMAGALVADTLSLLIFAGITSVVAAGSLNVASVAWIAVKVVAFFAVAWLAGTRLLPPAWRWLQRRGMDRAAAVPLVLLVALAFAEGAHLAGLHGILGTFVAGLALREAIGERRLSHDLTGLVRDVSLGFLAPVFFVTAGFEVTFAVFRDAPGLLAAVIVLATLGKVVGTALAYLPTGNGWREGVVLGAGMNGRGAVEIIIAGIGLQAGIIDRTTFSILVLMAIATTATVPLLLTWGVRWLTDRGELVRSTGRDGTLVVGAGPLARALARRLQERGPVALVDRNAEHVEAARAEGMTAHLGDALDGDVLASAGIEEASTVVALTPNAEVNVLVVQRARERWLVEDLYALLPGERDGGLFAVLEGLGGRVLFARPADPAAWDARIRSGGTREVTVEVGDDPNAATDLARRLTAGAWLPLALVRGDAVRPFGDDLEEGDRVIVL
ncbi:MAG: sodium:proton exchanger, partial [Deinococcus-Thermus bacterium]|nr:sodium:proton exchanger [Deinococcota bacterium]